MTGFHNTHWIIKLRDGSLIREGEKSWKSFSDFKVVKYVDTTKQVYLSNIEIESIEISLGELKTKIEVPEGCQVYQLIKSSSDHNPNGEVKSEIIGRVVGVVKQGIITEERTINKGLNEIIGFKIKI